MRKKLWVRYCQFSKVIVTKINPINKLLQREIFLARESRKREIFNHDSVSGVRRWAAFTMTCYPTQYENVTKHHAEKWHQKCCPVFLTLSFNLTESYSTNPVLLLTTKYPGTVISVSIICRQVAQELDIFCKEKLHRFCSGNPQILGIMDNNIKQVVCLPTASSL